MAKKKRLGNGMHEVMPFGKHKGDTLAMIVSYDYGYACWLTRQPWFGKGRWKYLRTGFGQALNMRRTRPQLLGLERP